MAFVEIPTRSDLSAYSFKIDLDGRTYGFEIVWNARSERYFMSITDSVDTPIVQGVPLVVNYDLLSRYVNPALPQGLLMLVDTSDRAIECRKEDLGNRCLLVYQGVTI